VLQGVKIDYGETSYHGEKKLMTQGISKNEMFVGTCILFFKKSHGFLHLVKVPTNTLGLQVFMKLQT